MIDIFGKTKIQTIKSHLKDFKKDLAHKTHHIIKDNNISLFEVSAALRHNRYKVSYILRNPQHSGLESILKIATRVTEILNPEFKESKRKYVVHPITIKPQNAKGFYLSSSDMADLFGVNFGQCISERFATETHKQECINLKLQ